MKIREIYQPSVIKEESWQDIAMAALAGKDVFGKVEGNRYNAEIEKSKAGQDWLVKNFASRANRVNPPNPEKYREIAKQLLDQLMSNQTGGFKNLLMTMGLKDRPVTDIETFINDIKKSFGNDLRSLPELSRVLDNLGRTYDNVLTQSTQHQSGQQTNPDLQRLMGGFAAIWYNLPSIMKDAINRSVQSARYGEQWIDAGGGVEIKPESNLDRRIAARFNDEVFNLQNNKWRDSLNSEAPEDIQAYLNNALQIAQLKQKTPLVKTTAAPNTAASTTAQSQTGSQQPVIIKDTSGTEFQYNDKDKTWSASGEIISDPRMIERLNQLALPQFQNRAMGLKTRGRAK